MKTKGILASAFFMLFPVVSAIAAGSIYVENGDAGNLLGTAQLVPGGINQINGSISFYPDVDLYQLRFDSTANVSVDIQTPGSWFDTDVTIFNQYGNPLAVYDNPSFSWNISPGTYYFAIADWDIAALNASGQIIADDYTGILKPSEVLGGWLVTSSPYRTGPYEINLSVSTVPEPATLLLLGLGAVMLRKK